MFASKKSDVFQPFLRKKLCFCGDFRLISRLFHPILRSRAPKDRKNGGQSPQKHRPNLRTRSQTASVFCQNNCRCLIFICIHTPLIFAIKRWVCNISKGHLRTTNRPYRLSSLQSDLRRSSNHRPRNTNIKG